MGKSLAKALSRTVSRGIREDGRWIHSESGIVVDNNDPDRQHRIKVTIPSIDEDNVFDDWVSPATPFSLGDGFGSAFIPEIGSEVLLTGVLGQKYNLVYHGAVYNETASIPQELGGDTPGFKVPKNLSFIAGLLLLLQAQNIRAIAEQLAHVEGENVEVIASQLAKMMGENAQMIASSLATIQGQNTTIEADQTLSLSGNTVTLHADGSISIQASGNISISATGVLTLQSRVVNKARARNMNLFGSVISFPIRVDQTGNIVTTSDPSSVYTKENERRLLSARDMAQKEKRIYGRK